MLDTLESGGKKCLVYIASLAAYLSRITISTVGLEILGDEDR